MKRYLLHFWIIAAPCLAAAGEVEIFIGEVAEKTIARGIDVSLSTPKKGEVVVSIIQRGKGIACFDRMVSEGNHKNRWMTYRDNVPIDDHETKDEEHIPPHPK